MECQEGERGRTQNTLRAYAARLGPLLDGKDERPESERRQVAVGVDQERVVHASEVVDALRAGPSAKGFGVSARVNGERGRRKGATTEKEKNHVLDVQLQARIGIATLDDWTARVGDADDVDEAMPLQSVAEDVDAVDPFGLAFLVQLGIVAEWFGQVLQCNQTAASRVSEILTK